MLRWKLVRVASCLLLACAVSVSLLSLAWADLTTARAHSKSVSQDTSDPATPCPLATPEPLWVEPVVTSTDRFTQTVVVFIGNGEAVTVTAESGTFAEQGDFDAYAHPASIEIALWPAVTHHLTVYGRVKTIVQGECVYGGYTLGTTRDRYGAPLVIQQQGGTYTFLYLPIVNSDSTGDLVPRSSPDEHGQIENLERSIDHLHDQIGLLR